MLAKRAAFLAALVIVAVLAFAAIAVVGENASAHPGHQQKKLFDSRWHFQPQGGNYDEWMTLDTSAIFFRCGTSEGDCASRWQNPTNAAINDWNGQDTTVQLDVQSTQDDNHPVHIYTDDIIALFPLAAGLAMPYDENFEFCLEDCPFVHYSDVFVSDYWHEGYSASQRQGTMAHEIGHVLSLRHESVNTDESILYECGMDDTGPIPESIMSYDCINPPEIDGEDIFQVQPWDVCGVNHAYPDPYIGFAGCTNFQPPVPGPFTWGDLNCQGGANPVDALAALRYDAGQAVNSNGCPQMGELLALSAANSPVSLWGDVDCSSLLDPIDGLKLLRYDAGLNVVKVDPNCPNVGQNVVRDLGGTPTPGATSTPTPAESPTSTPTGGGTTTPTPEPTETPTPTPTPTETTSPNPTATLPPGASECENLPQPVPIPDNDPFNPAVVFAEFQDNRTIVDLNICINIDHSWVGDLVVELEHVDTGTTAILLDINPSCDKNDVRVAMDDEAAVQGDTMCNASSPALSGPVRPTEPLSTFDGESIDGTWFLYVYDLAEGDTGDVVGAFFFALVS